MEPLDPGKNDENTGFSNRHIFSILKAPRKSIRFPDSEQQENQVESAKPVERRNSRRVSFAPANDVLLFSNDVKKSSSVRSTLQELMTTVPTQNRVQVTSEDEIQQIMGMETLLNAPLHGSDQKEKANSDTGFGEKTMIYCDDDGFLDLTQSHTINIAFCEDDLFGAPQKTGSNFLSSGKSTADCVSSDINPMHTLNMARIFEFPPDGRNTGFSQSVPSCGPTLTHSLPSLSKPTALKMKPSNATVNPSLSQTKTQKANVDKENHVPSFFRNAGNVRESSCGSTLCQDEDVNMDVTHTGRVTGLTADDDDDPFQGLFPTKEMYSQSDRGSQQSQNQENPQKQATATPKASEDRCQRVKAEEDCREKTVRFTAEDMCMDITKSNTGKITTDLSDPPNLAIFGSNRKAVSSMEKRHRDTIGMSSCAMNLNPGLQNVLRTSKPKDISINARYSGLAYPLLTKAPSTRDLDFPEDELSMDMTEVQTGLIIESTGNVDPINCLRLAQEMHSNSGQTATQQLCTDKRKSSCNTAKETSLNAPLRHQASCDTQEDCREKTIKFTADGEVMDVTKSHTVNMACFLPMQSHKSLPTNKERTIRFSVNDADMDVTQSHTANIALVEPEEYHYVDLLPAGEDKTIDAALQQTHSQTANIANSLRTGAHHNCDVAPAGKDRTLRSTADDASVDVTRCHTVRIDTPFEPSAHNVDVLPAAGEKTMRCTAMDETQSHTAYVANYLEQGAHHNVNFVPAGRETTLMFTADDYAMDETQSHTSKIGHFLKTGAHHNFDIVPAGKDRTVRFTAEDASMDVTRCHTGRIVTPFDPRAHNVDILPPTGKKTMRCTAMDAALEKTRSHTANIATHLEPGAHLDTFVPAEREKTLTFTRDAALMDETQSHIADVANYLKTGPHHNCYIVPSGKDRTVRFTADDASMDVTRSHTVKIETPFEKRAQNVDILSVEGEKTMRCTAMDAALEVTRRHTANMATHLEPGADPIVNFLPAGGEKTVRFIADDAAMDVTKCHTVQIDTPFEREVQNFLCVPAKGEKTLRFTADDAAMDVTKCHTVKIETPFELDVHNDDCVLVGGEKTTRLSADDVSLDGTQSHTHIATHLDSGADLNVNFVPTGADKPLRFTADDAAMNVTKGHTVKMYTPFELQAHNVDCVPVVEEKTTRFSAENISLGGTQIHTPDIATCLKQGANLDNFEPVGREKTLMFTADDASMDVTRCHTLRINTPFELKVKNVNCVPVGKEKTTRFSADDDTLDETKRQTPDIAAHFEQRAHYGNFVPVEGDKTFRFTADDAAMDVKKCHTVKIDTPFDLEVKNVDFVPVGGEKTTRLSTDDASLDGTQGYSANIASTFEPQNKTNVDTWPAGEEKILGFSADDAATDEQQRPAINTSYSNEDSPTKNRDEIKHPPKNGSSPVLPIHTGLRRANPIVTKDECLSESSSRKTGDTDHFILTQHKTPCIVNKTRVPTLLDNSVSDAKNMQCSLQRVETDASMDVTKAQTGSIVGEKYSNGNEHSSSQLSTQDPDGGVQKIRRATSPQPNQELGLSKQDAVEIANVAYSVYSDETDIRNVSELGHITSPLLANFNLASAVGHDSTSKKSRRKSFADLQLKVRHLSRLINMTPETPAMESCTAPLPHMDPGINTNPKNNDLLPIEVPDVIGEMGNTEGEAQDLPLEYATAETPFKLKNLMSRLSMGDFKPKLPQKNRVDDSKKSDSSHMNSERKSDPTTNNIANDMGNWKDDVSDIYDEELGRCEDLLGTLDTSGSPKMTANVIPVEECYISQNLRDDVFKEENPNCAPGIKRRLPSDEGHTEEEKKLKMSPEMVPETVKMTMDSSSTTHTSSSRGEVTFNSTFKQSMFESQLEDYSSDVQRKLEDGTITVSEFFKLFNIDFVIHKPRQSILRGRPSSDTDRTPIDVMKDRLINRPKERVYEADIKSLTEKVEGLSYRMCDLNKPLKMINTALWEEMKNSSEKEIKSFGVKLKERNNYFRKMSRVRSHEMKEVLYTGVVQALTDEQQNLRSSVEKSEETVKMLNDCIRDLEAELAAIEDKGTDTKPSLKSLQEELKKVNESMDENERQICDLETQKNQASSKLKSLKADTKNLESSIAILNMLNEWRLKEKRGNYTVYTFLNDTLHLQLVYKGNGTAEEPEQETSEINFTFLLDDTSSQCHARLVHKLISQYIYGQTLWVKKYPTSNHVQKLLYDVSLVVSHCRLLGEEIRLLKMWGGLRLKILDISCEDTRIHIVFSSLRRCSKFEVSFSVSLDKHIYGLHVHSFRNIFGDATIQQIVSIVKSFVPARKLLTKIVKKIHADLLSSAEYVQSTTEVFNK